MVFGPFRRMSDIRECCTAACSARRQRRIWPELRTQLRTRTSWIASIRPPDGGSDAFLAWHLEHYLVPDRLLNDGAWLYGYLERRLAAADSEDPIDAFVPVADPHCLGDAWIAQAPKPLVVPFQSPISALMQSRSWRIHGAASRRRRRDTHRHCICSAVCARTMLLAKALLRAGHRDAKPALGVPKADQRTS